MRVRHALVSLAALAALVADPARAVVFTFDVYGNDILVPDQRAALETAGKAWTSYLSDPITVKLQVGFRALGDGMLAGAVPAFVSGSANAYRSLLASDAKGPADAIAAASLATITQSALGATSAEARALGLTTPTVTYDGVIEFNSSYAFSTTRAADGTIAPGTYDLIGVAEHEIGHVLGFISSLDGALPWQTVLDQFRYGAPGVRSVAAGSPAYFSIDGGVTDLADFSTGGNDNYQASHWTTASPGLMRPAIGVGETQNITAADLRAFDAIGYDRTALAAPDVPEPAGWATMVVGLGLVGASRRRLARASTGRRLGPY